MRQEHWGSEAEFFDQVAVEHGALLAPIDPLAWRRYSSPGLRRRFARELRLRQLGDLRGKRILDVGCGEGTDSVLLAKLGAQEVVGIDISPRAIELARRRSLINGVAPEVELVCAPIETADLPARSFDIVWCNAILHHLTDNLDLVMRQMAGWAKSDGVLSFSEPINFNQTLRRIRELVPVRSGEVTDDERPLEPRDIEIIRRYVPDLEIRHFSLLGRLDQFILTRFNYEHSSLMQRAAVNLTAVVDWLCLSVPQLQNLGSVGVMWGHPARAPSVPAAREIRERSLTARSAG
ncbi:MAG: methyltransferase domain-containing protein [Polyangia bacterium]